MPGSGARRSVSTRVARKGARKPAQSVAAGRIAYAASGASMVCVVVIAWIALSEAPRLLWLSTGILGVIHLSREIGRLAILLVGFVYLLLMLQIYRLHGKRIESEALARRRTEVNYQTLVEVLPVASYTLPLDTSRSRSYISPEIEVMLGCPRHEWESNPALRSELLHEADREWVLAAQATHLQSGERFLAEYRMVARNHRVVWVRDEAVIIRDHATGAAAQHGVMLDITERKNAEEALRHRALHDALTDLPNRTLLQDRLHQAIVTAQREQKTVALLLTDLDRFKEVNDTFGHAIGDILLTQVVHRLREALRESDTIARLGGDEFAIVLPDVGASGAVQTVQRIVQLLRRPFYVGGQVLDVDASFGVALYPDHGREGDTLLQRADVAMYRSKRSDNGYALYEPNHDPYSPGRLTLIGQLRQAIEQDEMVLHYQPKAQFRTGRTNHFEALLRWEHREHGTMLPDEFIALAEHAGLMKPLNRWVLNAALRQCHEWRACDLDLGVAVNLSARTVHDPELVDTIGSLLQHWKIDPRWLEVEITEGALMVDPAGAMETLTRLHTMGVSISIDDFGTGYSSLSYLTRLPADQIKIDKSFVLNIIENDDSAFIVRSVIDLGHNLKLQVVAEGIENQETWDLLASMGCDGAQGYHLSRPLAPTKITEWLGGQESSLSHLA